MASPARDVVLKYMMAGLRPPYHVVIVPSPVVAVVAGAIAAGIWQTLRLDTHPLSDRIRSWLLPRVESAGPIETAVRAATRAASQRARSGSAAFAGPYPPHWTEEDKLVWEATSGSVCQTISAISFGNRVDADERRPAALPDLSRRVLAMIDRGAWDGPDNLPAERDYTVNLGELPALLDRLFGDASGIGRRFVRLGSRMLAIREASGLLSPAQPGLLHADFVLVSDGPVQLSIDDAGRPHSADGPYCRWADGSGLYAIHGVQLPAYLFERPETLTVQVIEQQRDAEVRRVMIERYGSGRFLRDSQARIVDHDPKFGTLYRKEMAGDEPMTMVAVINVTPEPDGTRKEYFLRVPPDMTSVRAAVAWTFGLRGEEYAPLIET